MPSRLPPHAATTKAGSLPSTGLSIASSIHCEHAAVFNRRRRYYEPLGLPPDTASFHRRLIEAATPDVGRRDGSLQFRTELCPHALLHTPRASCTPPEILTDAVYCLRRDMIGSATRPFGFLCHEAARFAQTLGLRIRFPP